MFTYVYLCKVVCGEEEKAGLDGGGCGDGVGGSFTRVTAKTIPVLNVWLPLPLAHFPPLRSGPLPHPLLPVLLPLSCPSAQIKKLMRDRFFTKLLLPMFTTDKIIMQAPAVLFMSQLGEVLLDLMGS